MSGVRGAPHHLVVCVSDLAASLDSFYRPLLGQLGYAERSCDAEIAVFYSDAAREEFAVRQARTPLSGAYDRYQVGFHHFAWWAYSRADVDALHDKLRAWGAPILDAPAEYPEYGPGYYAVFFTDPDGLKYEFTHQEAPKR